MSSRKLTLLLTMFLVLISAINIMASQFSGVPTALKQYNGSTINVYISSEGEYKWYHDKDGYPIVKNGDKYVYALSDGYNLIPTSYVVGEVNPIFTDLVPFEVPSVNQNLELSSGKAIFDNVDKATGSIKAIARGNVTPLVIFLEVGAVSPSTDVIDNVDKYFTAANDFIIDKTLAYSDAGKEFNYFSATSCISYSDIVYNSNYSNTIEKSISTIASKITDPSILDINNDGYIDEVIFVNPTFTSTSNTINGVFNVTSKIKEKKFGKYAVISEATFKSNFDLAYELAEGADVSPVYPIDNYFNSIVIFLKSNDKTISADDKKLLIPKLYSANSYLDRESYNQFGYNSFYIDNQAKDGAYYDVDGSGGDINIINTLAEFGGFWGPGSFDNNGDKFIDNIILVYSSEIGVINYTNSYENQKIKFRGNSNYYIGKVTHYSADQIASLPLSYNALKLANFRNLSRNSTYAPATQFDMLSDLPRFAYTPISLYTKRQAGWLEKFGSDDNRKGIRTITEEDTMLNGAPRVFSINASTNTPSKKLDMTYKIQSPKNPYDEYWIEYRKYPEQVSIQQMEGLYVYRVCKLSEALGNSYSGQSGSEYIPDEVYFFRTDGQSDYQVPNPTSTMNGDYKQANFAKNFSRDEFSYKSNPAAFLSNGDTNVGFKIYDISANGGDTMTFKVLFNDNPPKCISIEPNNVSIDAYYNKVGSKVDIYKDDYTKTTFTTVAEDESGVSNIYETKFKFEYETQDFLNLTFNNDLKTITLAADSSDTAAITGTSKIGQPDEDGNDVLFKNKYFIVNVTESSYEYIDKKLVVHYVVSPTALFLDKSLVWDRKYMNNDAINMLMSVKTYEGLEDSDSSGNTLIQKGIVRYTKLIQDIKFENLTPINQKYQDYYIRQISMVGSYGTDGNKVENLGAIYRHSNTGSAFIFDYVDELEIGDKPINGSEVVNISGTDVSFDYELNVTGFLVHFKDKNGNNVGKPVFAITKASAVVSSVSPSSYEDTINSRFTTNYILDIIKAKVPDYNVLDWTETNDSKASITVGSGIDDNADNLLTIPYSGFSNTVLNGKRTVVFNAEFNDVNMPKYFATNTSEDTILFDVIGFASYDKSTFDVLSTVYGGETAAFELTDVKQVGYYGIGGANISKPIVESLEFSPLAKDNDFISSKILPFDKNVEYKVTYKPNTLSVSEIKLLLLDKYGARQLEVKYNIKSKRVSVYNTITKQWIMGSLFDEKNIDTGNFYVPCNAMTVPVDNGDGSYTFGFVARSKNRFIDNPLTMYAIATDIKANVNDEFKLPNTYIYKSDESNSIPTVNSVAPNSGSLNTQSATNFKIKVTDNDGIEDLNEIYFILSYGGVKECYVKYNYQTRMLSLLTSNGWSDEVLINTTGELLGDNFKIDVKSSYMERLSAISLLLNLNITPLSAFSGNSLTVLAGVNDISIIDNNASKYALKQFGFVTIKTSDPKAIKLSSKSITLTETETYALKVLNEGTSNEVAATWKSSNTSVATVSTDGVVTAVNSGAAKITATTKSNVSLTCNVKVIDSASSGGSSVASTPKAVVISSGNKLNSDDGIKVKGNFNYKTTTTVIPKKENTVSETTTTTKVTTSSVVTKPAKTSVSTSASAKSYIGSSKNSNSESSRSNGSNGNTKASSSSNNSGNSSAVNYTTTNNTTELSVNPANYATKLSFVSVVLEKGDNLEVKGLTSKDLVDNTLTWSSSNSNVATVVAGVVNAKSIGSVIITATTLDGKKLTCNVKVISVQQGMDTKLTLGKTLKIKLLNVKSWKSSNPAVATVNERGVVTALKEGTVKILATTDNKVIDSTIIVK